MLMLLHTWDCRPSQAETYFILIILVFWHEHSFLFGPASVSLPCFQMAAVFNKKDKPTIHIQHQMAGTQKDLH